MTLTADHPPLVLPGTEGAAATPSVIFSFGMGVDSVALILRWLEEPASRDFDLADLVMITAQVGDEFDSTRQLVEDHVLPRLRRAGVRFIQCARSQRKTTAAGGGVVILDDSRAPQRLFFDGSYTLSQEMISQGTIPQLGGFRACSIHAKGNILDSVIAAITQGQPYRHVIGFEANEQGRALKDSGYNSEARRGWYPLVEWGFTRQDCLDYIAEKTGVVWLKSACGFCPFAMTNETGRRNLMQRYRTEPALAAKSLLMEDIARRLNPRQTLIAGSSLADVVAAADLRAVQAALESLRAELEFAVYEVRRVTPRARNGHRGVTARSVRAVARGNRAQMDIHLAGLPGERILGEDQIVRHHLPAGDRCEHLFVVAPALVDDKQRPQFNTLWQEHNADGLF
jgi:hypothetical protein